VIWAAGVQSSPAARWLNIPADRAGRAIIAGNLRAPEPRQHLRHRRLRRRERRERPQLPGVAPVAKQQGVYAARVIKAAFEGNPLTEPFAYVDYGNLATVGRKAAVADFRGFHLKGFIGWLVWCAAHIYYLIGFKNRIAVALDWTWSYLTFDRGARLITGDIEDERPQSKTAKRDAA
jgi:NADH dehydrogenase